MSIRLSGLKSLELTPSVDKAQEMLESKNPLLFLRDREYNSYYHLLEEIASGIDPDNDPYLKACVSYFKEELEEEIELDYLIKKTFDLMVEQQKKIDAKEAVTPRYSKK